MLCCLQVKRYRQQGGLAGPDGIKSVFGQLCSRWHTLKPEDLLLPHRIWKVKFIGESVDDVGGGYSESIAEMCEELQNGAVPILIPTPNGREETGVNRDCFILNPEATSPIHLNMFRFLGALLGIAIRSGSPVDLRLAPPVWKQLVGESLTLQDLSEVDSDYIQGLLYLQVHIHPFCVMVSWYFILYALKLSWIANLLNIRNFIFTDAGIELTWLTT